MRQNTSSPRAVLPFQCFHTCAAPGTDRSQSVLFVRGAHHSLLRAGLISFAQHEPDRTEMQYTGSCSGIHRFVAPASTDHGANFQCYCFKITLLSADGQIRDIVWYSSLGMSRDRPLLRHCFAAELCSVHPDWAANAVFYQVFPDKFAASRGRFNIDGTLYEAQKPVKNLEFEYKNLDEIHCGGDLDGLTDMLPYIKDLGCDTVYLNPIFSATSVHKYDTTDYDTIDSHLGGNGALKRLRATTLGLNMRLLIHGTFNHTGDHHPWFDRHERTGKGAMHHKDSPYREFYAFGPSGEPRYSLHDVRQPKLDYGSRQVRYAFFDGENSVVRKWLREPYSIDGFVIDRASLLGDRGGAHNNTLRLQQICAAARETRHDCLMVGEFHSDARYALGSEGGVDGSLNYTGFIGPVRAFFGGVNLKGEPLAYTGEDLRRNFEEYSVGLSQQVKLCLVNQLDNHLLPRFFEIIGSDRSLYLAALATLFTWRGIPCIYQGDELGDVLTQYGIGPRSLIPFAGLRQKNLSSYNSDLTKVIRELADLRRSNCAISHGTMIFILAGGAHFGFIRIFNDRFCLTLVNAGRGRVQIEQEGLMFPLLAAICMPDDCQEEQSEVPDYGDSLLIPLSGRNVRRTDHGAELAGLYALLGRQQLEVRAYGAVRTGEELAGRTIRDLIRGRPLSIPGRTALIIQNLK